jgi:hypothetical protein
MGILDQIFRDIFEQKAGRIHISPGGWDFNPPAWLVQETMRKCPNLFIGGKPCIRQDADRKDMTLVHRKTVCCPREETCNGIYPRFKPRVQGQRPTWYFPESLCRKCQFREKTSRKYRFPRCLCKASANPGMDALQGTFGALQDAANKTRQIMGEPRAEAAKRLESR